jgi:hypothetical protein
MSKNKTTTFISYAIYFKAVTFILAISPLPNGSWIQTLDLSNRSLLFYHCAPTARPAVTLDFSLPFSFGAKRQLDSNP